MLTSTETDLFISYAWTSPEHREWVRLFASHLHLIGYNVKIDEDIEYGSSLNGFMKEVTNSNHVLLIIDENYVDRADNLPESGVGIENKWIKEVFSDRPANWLSILFIRNLKLIIPSWLKNHKPKGFDFNAFPDRDEFPGTFQINELWRWIEGLPANKSNSVSIAELRQRIKRLERIEALRDPSNYVSPAVKGRVTYKYRDFSYYTLGHGEYEFKINFSGKGDDSVFVYKDYDLKALGIITTQDFDTSEIESFLTSGRAVAPRVGQKVILLNAQGVLCIILIDEVQPEINKSKFIAPHLIFTYEILVDS